MTDLSVGRRNQFDTFSTGWPCRDGNQCRSNFL